MSIQTDLRLAIRAATGQAAKCAAFKVRNFDNDALRGAVNGLRRAVRVIAVLIFKHPELRPSINKEFELSEDPFNFAYHAFSWFAVRHDILRSDDDLPWDDAMFPPLSLDDLNRYNGVFHAMNPLQGSGSLAFESANAKGGVEIENSTKSNPSMSTKGNASAMASVKPPASDLPPTTGTVEQTGTSKGLGKGVEAELQQNEQGGSENMEVDKVETRPELNREEDEKTGPRRGHDEQDRAGDEDIEMDEVESSGEVEAGENPQKRDAVTGKTMSKRSQKAAGKRKAVDGDEGDQRRKRRNISTPFVNSDDETLEEALKQKASTKRRTRKATTTTRSKTKVVNASEDAAEKKLVEKVINPPKKPLAVEKTKAEKVPPQERNVAERMKEETPTVEGDTKSSAKGKDEFLAIQLNVSGLSADNASACDRCRENNLTCTVPYTFSGDPEGGKRLGSKDKRTRGYLRPSCNECVNDKRQCNWGPNFQPCATYKPVKTKDEVNDQDGKPVKHIHGPACEAPPAEDEAEQWNVILRRRVLRSGTSVGEPKVKGKADDTATRLKPPSFKIPPLTRVLGGADERASRDTTVESTASKSSKETSSSKGTSATQPSVAESSHKLDKTTSGRSTEKPQVGKAESSQKVEQSSAERHRLQLDPKVISAALAGGTMRKPKPDKAPTEKSSSVKSSSVKSPAEKSLAEKSLAEKSPPEPPLVAKDEGSSKPEKSDTGRKLTDKSQVELKELVSGMENVTTASKMKSVRSADGTLESAEAEVVPVRSHTLQKDVKRALERLTAVEASEAALRTDIHLLQNALRGRGASGYEEKLNGIIDEFQNKFKKKLEDSILDIEKLINSARVEQSALFVTPELLSERLRVIDAEWERKFKGISESSTSLTTRLDNFQRKVEQDLQSMTTDFEGLSTKVGVLELEEPVSTRLNQFDAQLSDLDRRLDKSWEDHRNDFDKRYVSFEKGLLILERLCEFTSLHKASEEERKSEIRKLSHNSLLQSVMLSKALGIPESELQIIMSDMERRLYDEFLKTAEQRRGEESGDKKKSERSNLPSRAMSHPLAHGDQWPVLSPSPSQSPACSVGNGTSTTFDSAMLGSLDECGQGAKDVQMPEMEALINYEHVEGGGQ